MSMLRSRRDTASTSEGSVIPAREHTVTLVKLRRPTTCSSSRSSGARRCRRSRLVLVRTVSVKASLALLMVVSTWGGAIPRFSPVLTSKAAASSLPNSTRQNPLTSSDAAVSRSGTGTETAFGTCRRAASSPSSGRRLCCRGLTTKSEMSVPDTSPSMA